MKRLILSAVLVLGVVALVSGELFAKTGDTTHVSVISKYLWKGYGSIENWGVFPPPGKHYEKVLLRYQLTCPSPSCGQWDYTNQVFLRQHTGIIDSTLKDAPNFTVGTSTVDSFAYSRDTTRSYSYNSTKKTTDSSANSPQIVYFYRNAAKPFLATDSMTVWQAGYYNHIYNDSGKAIDSFLVRPDSVLHMTSVKAYYHYERINQYEIARYITPYGQGFPQNWNYVWTMDVTDYAFMLHDSVDLLSAYQGYTQGSLYSLSFDFIEGTPPRETYQANIIYDGYYGYGDTTHPISLSVTPKRIWLDPNADVVTWRTLTTGHGNAGPDAACEFLENTDTVVVNGKPAYLQHLWRTDCGANPVYPQTGTWTLSRAGWCPGDKVDPWDYDMTHYGAKGDSITVGYSFPFYNIGGGGYAIHTQVLYSKGPQFSNDVAMMSIQAPTNEPSFRRTNPICSHMAPIITFRNNGKDTLHSLVIRYGKDSTTTNTFNWTGSLPYMQTALVTLPGIDLGVGTHTFNVLLDEPNGVSDEYTNNNYGVATYTMPKVYSNNIYLTLKTDDMSSAGLDNGISYQVLDVNDNVLFGQDGLPDGTIIRDTFKLATGCYRFVIYDSSQIPQGLYPWFIQGATFGYYTLKDDKKATLWNATTSNNLASFGPREIVPFMAQAPSSVSDEPLPLTSLPDVPIYPDPAVDHVTLDLAGFNSYAGDVRISVVDLLGKEIVVRTVQPSDMATLTLNLQYYPAGAYFLRVQSGTAIETKRFILQH